MNKAPRGDANTVRWL